MSQQFLQLVLEAYFQWRGGGPDLGFVQFGNLIGLPEPIENRRVIDMSEDQFTRVDQAYAQLNARAQELLAIEYRSTGGYKQKARQAGYEGSNVSAIVGHYKRDLGIAQGCMQDLLRAELEEWEGERP